jgi:hypothetical protein
MVSDYKAVTFLTVMLSVNVILYLVGGAIAAENPSYEYANLDNSTAGQLMDSSGEFSGSVENAQVESETVTAETGNTFTDTWQSIKGWFNDLEEKFSLLTGILKQPAGFMKEVGVPQPIRVGFAVIWYSIALMLIIGFFRGGNQ